MSRDNERPDPDALLRAVHKEERDPLKGRLRIFFGMSAGVGKTYAMLKAAQQRQNEGADVVIGIVETHGRVETAALLENLILLPKKIIEYKGATLEEMDLDGIIKRKPELVLVDELAHTNVPGSRHPKRYQDVLELLDRGFDVYTTVNVQHLESRKDSVEAITGIQIRETVPDSILERAHMVEVVDIAPSELLKRLKEGKVYLGDKAERAAQNFFKEDRLTALREIALRLTAERVDHDLQRFVEFKQASGPWQTNERLMVAVSHSPFSERLIRATRRLAYNLESPWIAVHVDNGIVLNDDDQTQLVKNINLARELKAEVVTTTDVDIAVALRRVARQKNVTQIVVGRPTRRVVKDLIHGGTLLDRLVREGQEIDVHVIRQDEIPNYQAPYFRRFIVFSGPINYWNTLWYLFGIGLISGLLEPAIGYRAVGFVFLLGVLVVGSVASIGPTIFAAVSSALAWNFFFIPPRLTFVIRSPEDVIMCFSFLVVALITGFLTTRIRSQERTLREREDRTNVLYEVSQDIAGSSEKSEFIGKVNDRMSRLFGGHFGVVLRGLGGKLDIDETRIYSPMLNEKEKAVATWAFETGNMAGWSTDTLSEAKGLYIPLKSPGETVGVWIYTPKTTRKLSLEQENLLFAIARQLAIALERHFLGKRIRESERLEESEKLHQTLLNSISHEMRTPLTTIMGTATALCDKETPRTTEYIDAIAKELLHASDRLNRVIENLLDMSRLNSGVLALKLQWQDIHDLVGVTLKKLGDNLNQHKLVIDVPEKLPIVQMDFRFVEHALSNLLLNAATYTPAGTEIRISVEIGGAGLDKFIRLNVEDQGPGIAEESLEKVFEKFYRIPGTPTGGTGLGLSIVQSIAEAHKGRAFVQNRPQGGAKFTIEMPLYEAPEVPQGV